MTKIKEYNLKLVAGVLSIISYVDGQTNDEKPGSGARDRAMLFMTICPPFKLTTPLPSGSESV